MAPLHVLVVEDDPALRKVLEIRLGLEGFRVSLAEDGQAGLEAVDRDLPDAVITDLMMPRLDGFGFCRALRDRTDGQDVPVIVLTARQRDSDIEELVSLGNLVFMAKPFDPTALSSTLRRIAGVDAEERAVGGW